MFLLHLGKRHSGLPWVISNHVLIHSPVKMLHVFAYLNSNTVFLQNHIKKKKVYIFECMAVFSSKSLIHYDPILKANSV